MSTITIYLSNPLLLLEKVNVKKCLVCCHEYSRYKSRDDLRKSVQNAINTYTALSDVISCNTRMEIVKHRKKYALKVEILHKDNAKSCHNYRFDTVDEFSELYSAEDVFKGRYIEVLV